MSLVDLNPAGLNLASLKPTTATSLAQEEAGQVQADVARVQLANAQDEQQRNEVFRTRQAIAAKAPSVETYTELLAVAPREYVEGLKASIAQMDAASRKKLADQVLEPWLAGVNNRPDLMKERLKAQADGFEARGMKDKAAGIRDLLAKGDPDAITARLGFTLLESVGPERFKALQEAQGMTDERLKKKAERILAESKVTDERLTADRDKALAEARKEGDLAKVAAIEAEYARRQEESKLRTAAAQQKRDVASAGYSDLLTDRGKKTLESDVSEAAAKARKEAALATKAENEATPEALATERELKKQQVEKYKAEVNQLKTVLGDLPVGVQENVRKDIDTSTRAAAEAARIRRVETEYRKLKASGPSVGTPARLRAWVRAQMGSENKRDEIYRLAESVIIQETVNAAQAIRPVSDTDMEILRGDKPKATSNPEYVANYMGALARAREAQAMAAHDMAAWQTAFRGIGNARENTTINGRPVKAGMPLTDFIRGRNNPYVNMSKEELTAAIAAEKAARKAAGK
jgi:ParB family transcriptional regulator, chromosome partitioning protein